MTSPPSTPLHRRDIDFNMGAPIPAHWLAGHCHLTRFYDAMSIMFPEGERAFIETVRHYRDRIGSDADLAHAVKEFIAQEALHSREHVRYNRRMQEQGAPVERLERIVASQQAFARRYLPPVARLAITVCLEHFTAMFADQILRDPRCLEGAHPAMADIWHWHALEETEHKAVAFDVFTAAIRAPLRRYVLRCVTMPFVSIIFSTLLWRFTCHLVRHDGRGTDVRGWLHLLRVQFMRPGPLMRMLPYWLAWFRPCFHPWQHDNHGVMERFRQRFDRESSGGG
ncbi:metal-dependent hydrolase [Paraburkholderia sp. Tr-20389]|nr:metal-dependent hydrolase [Paraburkholderia sp. Tr-20389]